MNAGWIAVHLEGAPDRVVLVNADKVQAIGSDPEGGSRIIFTSGQSYDVIEDIAVIEAGLTRAGR